jgi:hypothetical protein
MDVPKEEFDIEKTLREILSDNKQNRSIFDQLLEKFENYSDRPAGSIGEIKRRDNKKAKGDGWEKFCHFYLSRVLKYNKVWLWKEIPEDVRLQLKLKSRVDNGIDLVCQRTPHSAYSAVQCKYRKKIIQTVTWTTLSTFVGLCAQTGPWEKEIVMTNCKGVSRKTGIEKMPKDQTIAYGTFSKLSRDQIVFTDPRTVYHVLDHSSSINKSIVTSQDDIRAARIAKFSNK